MKLAEQRVSTFEVLRSNPPVAILPIGTIEAHGYHCPLGTDMLIPEHLAARAEALNPELILVAPAVPYGRSLARWGLTNQILLNGHGGNVPALSIAAERIVTVAARELVDLAGRLKSGDLFVN